MNNIRTRANTSSHGKSKVYISGSDNGIKLYLDKIETHVLSEFNCAIYHNYPQALNESQVLLILIDRILLEQNNKTAEKKIKSAKENNIAIIPILLEDDVGNRYYDKFGDIEYLDFTSSKKEDKNKERFKIYLEKYISDDDMMQEIKNSFRNSIFLSYRKKDSTYAQKFIEEIHEDKRLQETSIWYDGFLEPGEDYSVEIAKEIKECDLFIISLTPYLLEPDNYVLKYEIPAAMENRKKILLVEMEEFDYSSNPDIKELEDYPMVSIVSISDTNRMNQLILDMLQSSKPVGYSTNIMDRYLMGRGYLSGYSVEKNTEIAYSFIEEAANARYLPAMKKLDKMYKDGDGVAYDIDLSLEWNEKYVHTLYNLYITNQEYRDSELLILEVWELVQRYLKYRKYKKAAHHINRLNPEKVQELDFRSSIYLLKGDLAHHYNENKEALEFFYKSLKIRTERLKNASSQDETLLYNEQIAICYIRLGDISKRESNFQQAINLYSIALDNRKANMEVAPISKSRRAYSVTLIRIAEIFLMVNQPKDALKYIEEALAIRISLNEEIQTVESVLDLAVTYSKHAKVNNLLGKFLEAEDSIKKSLEIRIQELKVHETEEVVIILVSTYYDLGEIYALQGNLYGTAICVTKGLEICEEEKWKESDELQELRAELLEMNGSLLISWGLAEQGTKQFICTAEIRSDLAQKKYLSGLDFRNELQNLARTHRLISTNIPNKGKLHFLEMEREAWKQLKQEYSNVEVYSEKYEEVLKIISDLR